MSTAESVSRFLTRIILSTDAHYRQQQAESSGVLDSEGLVPVHWAKEPFEVLEFPQTLELLTDCLAQATTLPDPWARDWLSEQTLAFHTLVRWVGGESLNYEQVVAGCLRVNPLPVDQAALSWLSARRDWALEKAGLGIGREGYAAFLEQDGVAPGAVEATLTALLAEGRERTLRRLPMLHTPAEPIGVRAVSGVPFSAYCDYPGRAVWINTDLSYTRSDLKHLVGHEAYPGHYVHMGHRKALVEQGRMPVDGALVVTNTASSVLFEGIAERGLDLLGWRDSPFDEVAWAQNCLEKVCTIQVAYGLNTGRMSAAEARNFLDQTCFGDPAWIDGRLRFVTHKLRAPFIYAYWWGSVVVGAWWKGVSAANWPVAVSYLYDRMHSPSTLAAHWPPVQDSFLA